MLRNNRFGGDAHVTATRGAENRARRRLARCGAIEDGGRSGKTHQLPGEAEQAAGEPHDGKAQWN